MKNELRIGNLLWNYGTIVSVSEIKEWTLIAKTKNMGFVVSDYKEFKPIQLTEDILLKCPQFDKEENIQQDYSCVLNINSRIKIVYYLGDKNCCSIFQDDKLIDLPYGVVSKLHQLQNLYWCLCGKELEINL